MEIEQSASINDKSDEEIAKENDILQKLNPNKFDKSVCPFVTAPLRCFCCDCNKISHADVFCELLYYKCKNGSRLPDNNYLSAPTMANVLPQGQATFYQVRYPTSGDKRALPLPVSPVAREGGGDISEREMYRERHNLQTTPPARLQPVHPKKQLFLTPVGKFTAQAGGPSHNLTRIRSCLDKYAVKKPPKANIGPKAVSMEDLTPTKKYNVGRKELPVVRFAGLRSVAEEQAAARVCRFMLVAAWRRRRDDVRCLRKTLEGQVSCSERLRVQVSTLKSLLDSDNSKVRLAMRELERLRQLLRDHDHERSLLEREKIALEKDICAAEDRASEMSIGWRNCRNELEGVRASLSRCEETLVQHRANADRVRVERDLATLRLSMLEVELSEQAAALSAAEGEVRNLRTEADARQRELEETSERLQVEQIEREMYASQCRELGEAALQAAAEATQLRAELCTAREQLACWPRTLTNMMLAARVWARSSGSLRDALLWALAPARHGC